MKNRGVTLVEIIIIVIIIIFIIAMIHEAMDPKQMKEWQEKTDREHSTHVISTDAEGTKLYRAYDDERGEYIYYSIRADNKPTSTDYQTSHMVGKIKHYDGHEVDSQ